MGAAHVHVHRGLLRAAAEEARLRENGDAREPLLADTEPALHRRVAVPGPQRPVVGARRGGSRAWTYAVAWAAPRGVCPRCVSAWSVCARWATAASVSIVGGHRSRWPS